MDNVVKIKTKINKGAKFPQYATDFDLRGNSGADLFANEDAVIPVGGRAKIGTGLFVEVPLGVDMQIRSKSGIAEKFGVIVLNTPGTVDPSYRGEVKVLLINLGEEEYHVKRGDKIAQAVFSPCLHAFFIDEDILSETVRGEGGFGSTPIR